MRIRDTWATPDVAASQVLVRQISEARGWRRRAEYATAYFRDGRDSPPQWSRRSRSVTAEIPGSRHPADLHDLGVLVAQAWAEEDDAWVAWPVHHPAAVRSRELRPFTPDEATALAAWRATSREPSADAGPFPVHLAVAGRGELALDGLRHELITSESTRCGIERADLTVLDQTFTARSPEACPRCARRV